jgi:hypothetical protein
MERIERDTFYEPNCGCWLYAGPVDEFGYGRIRINGKKLRVHRATFEYDNGKLPPEVKVMHSCDMPCCWNPDHLSAGTDIDNIADMDKKGRRSLRHSEVLTEDEVREIRIAKGSFRSIGRKYGVSHHTVADIQRGISWKYLP